MIFAMSGALRKRRFISYWRGVFLVSVVFFLSFGTVAHAGFGITPPYVKNERLTRGSTYEQKVTLVRSDPTEDLNVQITMNIPDVQSWFTIDRGTEFVLPKDVTQVPIVVRVQVPEDAEYKDYTGGIRIRTSPVNPDAGAGGVSIALGAQIDVAIKVVDKIEDFTVRKIRIADLEEGRKRWGLFFPGKIRFFTTIENTGNVPYGPTKVQFDIYDSEGETLLETTYNKNKIKRIEPFAIEEVVAELPTRLAAGKYKAKYTIYKGDEVAQQNEINVSISNVGAVLGYTGYGFDGLLLTDWLKIAAVVGVPLLILIALIVFLARPRKRRTPPPTYAPPSSPDWGRRPSAGSTGHF